MLLDLDEGWMRYYRNGERFGPGFTSGVAGPLLRAVDVLSVHLTVLPDAAVPAGAGDPNEPWLLPYLCHSVPELKGLCKARGLKVGGTKAVLQERLEADSSTGVMHTEAAQAAAAAAAAAAQPTQTPS